MSDVICLISELGLDVDAAEIELRLPPGFGGCTAAVAGDFTAWVPLPMEADPNGGFHIRLVLKRGSRFRYRFLVDNRWWMNDRLPAFDTGPNGAPALVLTT